MPSYQELKAAAEQSWGEISAGPRPQIFVGTATCGRAVGAVQVIEAIGNELARLGLEAQVHEVGCAGFCYAEPQVDIVRPGRPRVSYGNVTPTLVSTLLEDVLLRDNPRRDAALYTLGDGPYQGIPAFREMLEVKLQVRVAMRNCGVIDPTSAFQYIATGGYKGLDRALGMTPTQVLEEVQKSGLRGRGGAAFSTGQKWRFLAGARAAVKYHLCNAEEGDPGAFNDKGLLESDPFSVIEGMTIGGYATGSTYGYIFIRTVHREVIRRVDRALEEAYRYGLLGKNILGTDLTFDIEVAETGESYVSGEETALMESIEGKRAMPRYRPPFPAQAGLWGMPSNINNVKTYAYVPEILSRGGDWYASIGTQGSKGTALVCLTGNLAKRGMAEVPFGVTIREILEVIGGGVENGRRVKMLQTGGPLGGFLGGAELDIPLDFDGMAAKGAILGSGGIIVGDDTQCAVDMAKVLADFNHDESCGKCFPCRLGTKHMLDMLDMMSQGRAKPGDVERMLALTPALQSSLCGHGQLAVNPIKSAVQYFGQEIQSHIVERRCPTRRCAAIA